MMKVGLIGFIFYIFVLIRRYYCMKYVGLVFGLLILIYSSWCTLNNTKYMNQPQLIKTESLLIIDAKETEGTISFVGQTEGFFKQRYSLVFTKETIDIKLGSYVVVTGKAEPVDYAKNKYLFDYKKYNDSIGMFHQMFNPKIRIQEKPSVRQLIYQGKDKLKQYIEATFQADTKLFLQALFLKNTGDLRRQYIDFSEIGLLQVFTISLFCLQRLQKLCARLCRLIRLGKALEMIVVLTLSYVAHIYFWQSMTLQYLFIHCTIYYINSYVKNCKLNAIERLSLTGIILIFYNPYVIFNLGFIFVFVIRFGLFTSSHYLQSMKRYQKVFVFPLLLFGLMLPVTIYMQQSISFGQILFYVVAGPLNFIVFVVGLAVLLIPTLAVIFQHVSAFVLVLYDTLFPLYELLTIKVAWYFSFQSYLLYVLYFQLLRPQRARHRIRNICLIVCFISATLVLNTNLGSIHFLSLPHGEMTIIKDKGMTYVIDVGGSHKESDNIYQTETIILPFLQRLHIEQIDHLILTHDDIDHVGDFPYLIEHFPIMHVYYHQSTLVFHMLASKHNEVEYHKVTALTQIGTLQIFPVYHEGNQTISTNNLSLVTYGYFGGKRWLFMGDLEHEGERELLHMYPKLTIDVLKLGHHGSKTSSSALFLRTLKPQYAIITVQKRNRHHHPHNEVIQRLRAYEITYFNTNIGGSIHFFFWHDFGIFVIE